MPPLHGLLLLRRIRPDALASELALELGKGEHHVEGQAPQRGLVLNC
jgi:hypothetical protein